MASETDPDVDIVDAPNQQLKSADVQALPQTHNGLSSGDRITFAQTGHNVINNMTPAPSFWQDSPSFSTNQIALPTPSASFSNHLDASQLHPIFDTPEQSPFSKAIDALIPSTRGNSAEPENGVKQSEIQKPAVEVPPQHTFVNKGKGRAVGESEIEIDVPESPTLQRRKPRPRPIFGGGDANIFSTDHIRNPITPTTATGFGSLSLNGDSHEMSHDMSDELKNVPQNMPEHMRRFLLSQLVAKTPTSDNGKVAIDRDMVAGENTANQSDQFGQTRSTDTSPVQLHGGPSKRPRLAPLSYGQDVSPSMTSVPIINSLPSTQNHSGPKTRAESMSKNPNPRKRTFSQTYTPLEDLSYKRTNNPNFNVFTHGILRSPDLLFYFVTILPVRDFISLYSISRVFHKAVNQRFTTMVLSVAYRRAPEAVRVFPFRAYSHLSIPDPRDKSHPKDPGTGQSIHHDKTPTVPPTRRVPSLRYLQMIIYRTKVVHQIIRLISLSGIPLPYSPISKDLLTSTLLKIWFSMDLPDTSRRIGYFHNTRLFTNLNLFYATMFFIKLDQRFTDPISGIGSTAGVRRLCFGQRSLSYILKVLQGKRLKSDFDLLKEFVRYKYYPSNPAERFLSVFDIPARKLGRGCLINWGEPLLLETRAPIGEPFDIEKEDDKGGKVTVKQQKFKIEKKWVQPKPTKQNILVRPDSLVQRECVRRGLRMKRYTLRMLLWGYVDVAKLRTHQWDEDERFIPLSSEIESESDNTHIETDPQHDSILNLNPEPRLLPLYPPSLTPSDYSPTSSIFDGDISLTTPESRRDPLLDLSLSQNQIERPSRFVETPIHQKLYIRQRDNEREEAEGRFLEACFKFSEDEEKEDDEYPSSTSSPTQNSHTHTQSQHQTPKTKKTTSPSPSPSPSYIEDPTYLDVERNWFTTDPPTGPIHETYGVGVSIGDADAVADGDGDGDTEIIDWSTN
ncbi:hypothetical protein UCRPC4_g02942 [Phaeomoniella chlamydospora]|uniref:Uncharacterized protein n=1 Tax=Phaeomoniella chlamydospora TaxID=158046 RepID=A0A0G2EKY4_PHACM|nr:hypothetical protein UCRPC4_g02942 [Phaeomoniella chlamydospora]